MERIMELDRGYAFHGAAAAPLLRRLLTPSSARSPGKDLDKSAEHFTRSLLAAPPRLPRHQGRRPAFSR
ncbi:MAG: hypothetical protein H6730_16430 [Deltaproteobacteria bacterium]|nr:hypothetical protein [Deltaproteobacteria bacterium]